MTILHNSCMEPQIIHQYCATNIIVIPNSGYDYIMQLRVNLLFVSTTEKGFFMVTSNILN